MSESARRQVLLGLIISPPPVVQTLAGISTDIHHVVGNVAFDCFSSIHSRFEESALKIFRVSPTDHSQMDRVNNMLTVFSKHLSVDNAAYTHANISPCAVVNLRMITEHGPATFKALLTPWYSGGDILEHVKKFPAVNRITLLVEIGKALRHLHAQNVVHGAIHPSNILVDSDGRVVITDTGVHTLMSQFIFLPSGHLPIPPSAHYQSSNFARQRMHWFNQPHLWMFTLSPRRRARLLLFHFIQKSNSDVQQLHQIFEPFSDLPRFRRREQTIAEIYNCGQQCVIRPNNMSAELWALLRRCLAPDPALRPTMIEVVAVLESLSSYSHGMTTEVRNAVE